jgi:hypothetical protein
MAIGSDWNIDFTQKIISHIDGVLEYDLNGATAPAEGDYIRGDTSGAIGKVLSGTDLEGTGATGTFTLTNVVGRFQDQETITVLDIIAFDGVVSPGFEVGDTLYEAGGAATVAVYALEYDAVGGTGDIFGTTSGGTFVNNDELRITSNSGATVGDVAANQVDRTGYFASGVGTGELAAPTTSAILNFDNGTKDFIRFSKVLNASTTGAATATGLIQQTYGVQATGSLRLVDVTGTWANNDSIYVTDKVNYNNLQAGQSFKLNDTVSGSASSAEGKIIDVFTSGSTGTITLLNQVGVFSNTEALLVDDTQIANVASTAWSDDHADVYLDPITTQLETQGGIYSNSLNVVRDSNAFYTYLQDTFDELGALDDDIPMTAQVKLQQYTLINDWKIPDLSFRFLESGSIQDLALDNIWTDFQTLGSVNGIGDSAFAATTPQPQIYIEQNGEVVDSWWLAGHIDVLVKVKTSTRPDITGDATAGVNIDSGTVTIFCRRYGDTYDHFETTTIAGVAPIPLATSNDLDNTTGTHELEYDGEGSGPFTVGEEVTSGATKRGVITDLTDNGTTGEIEYILTGTSNFANNDTITGAVSGATAAVNGAPSNVVAGYDTHIIFAAAQEYFEYDGHAGTVAFIEGELVTINTGANSVTGVCMGDTNNTGSGSTGMMTIGNIEGSTGDISDNVDIVGDTSGATAAVHTGGAFGDPQDVSTIEKDIGDGDGATAFNAVVFLNRTGAAKQSLADMYEWVKYRTRRQETGGEEAHDLLGGAGFGTGNYTDAVAGRIYTTLNTSYALVKVSPIGSFAGGTFFGARGVFVQDMQDDDIRNFQLIDVDGTVRNPPNLQTLLVQGLVSGDRVAVFRRVSSTPGSEIYFDEFTVQTATSGSGTVLLQSAGRASGGSIPSDVPSTGVIRIYNQDTGLYDSYDYTSWDTLTFTIDGTLSQTYSTGNNLYIPLLQEQATGTSVSTNIIHSSNIPLLARVRKKGILPFEVEGTFISTGATITAIRTEDTIVD